MDIEKILLTHYSKFPKMEVQDFFKLIYQNTYGCEHLIKNSDNCFKYLENEWIETNKGFGDNIFEDIGNGYTRFNIYNGKNNEFRLNTILKIFIGSANLPMFSNSSCDIEEKINVLLNLCKSKKLNFDYHMLNEKCIEFRNTNYAPIHHSPSYREHYFPAYRVLCNQYVKYNDIVNAIDSNLEENKDLVIAIDGKCGGGKTLLGKFLKTVYDCNLISMDDFFMPIGMQNIVDGVNIDTLRFINEVYTNLKNKRSFSYGAFDCKEQQITKKINVPYKKLTIIEGSYSMCKSLIDLYDIKVFVDISDNEQVQRITKRNGEKMAKNFIEKWIPSENFYFQKYNIKNLADFILK